ncbi:MAG: 50S ribosome-binding GTPase [Synergistaceae bacterium]|nr:50S ribosome-binding GTPase [Synergistaceae bacterium]
MREISLVLGTAGHIDHGKTALINALTGINCDRLIEERKRGITIELGFAPLKLDDDRVVSVIDVPGHENLSVKWLQGLRELTQRYWLLQPMKVLCLRPVNTWQ